jgi:hypothetical protein
MDAGGTFPVVNRPGCEVNHPSPSNPKVKHEWNYTSTPPISLHGVDRRNVTFMRTEVDFRARTDYRRLVKNMGSSEKKMLIICLLSEDAIKKKREWLRCGVYNFCQ